MNSHSVPPSDEADRKAALNEFFAAVRTAAREADDAVTAAKPALERLASAIAGHDHGQAVRARSILISLYTGGTMLADVSDLLALDWTLRRDLCAVLLAFNHGEFSYDYLRAAFERAGDKNARWFLGAANNPRERLREALDFAKPGPLDTTPRSSSEKGVAGFVASLFAGRPVDLDSAVQRLDEIRRSLVAGLFAYYLAQRFDSDDRETVAEHFALD
ncbi:hypothetical protein OPIT5_06390 [Opitutaceae bacterium TAV5]|nr:hypothetical protein OPIT5_06390 [Opitutaceae bacterium TAV5]